MRVLLAVLALTFALAGCGDDDDEPTRSGGPEQTPSSSAPSVVASPATPVDEIEVCTLAEEADVEAAFGEDLGAGSFSSGSTDEDDVQWQSDICNWEIEDGLEVSLALSSGDDFLDGDGLRCPELDSFDVPSTPVEGLAATSAAWVNDKIDPNEGTLRICTDFALMDIDVESPDGSRDPATMQSQAVALAEVVLAHLA